MATAMMRGPTRKLSKKTTPGFKGSKKKRRRGRRRRRRGRKRREQITNNSPWAMR